MDLVSCFVPSSEIFNLMYTFIAINFPLSTALGVMNFYLLNAETLPIKSFVTLDLRLLSCLPAFPLW